MLMVEGRSGAQMLVKTAEQQCCGQPLRCAWAENCREERGILLIGITLSSVFLLLTVLETVYNYMDSPRGFLSLFFS